MKYCPKCSKKVGLVVSNLYWCFDCGYVLLDNENNNKYNLVSTDFRKLILTWEGGWNKVYSFIYQLDLLKIMCMAKHLGMVKYDDWAQKFINQIDKIEKINTDFNRLDKLPRVFLKDYIDKKG